MPCMAADWADARAALPGPGRWRSGVQRLPMVQRLIQFTARYDRHIADEETVAYPVRSVGSACAAGHGQRNGCPTAAAASAAIIQKIAVRAYGISARARI